MSLVSKLTVPSVQEECLTEQRKTKGLFCYSLQQKEGWKLLYFKEYILMA